MDELGQMDAELERLADAQRGNKEPPLPATFLVEAVHDEAKSAAAGRPVWVDVEMVEINVGRDIIRRVVTQKDREAYARQYLAWKKGQDQESVEGFPLSQWAAIPGKAVVKEFALYGIRTVEQLAAATDSTIQRIGPHMQLRQKARDWVADAAKQAPLSKLRDENEALKARLAALEKMVERQTGEIKAARENGGVLPAAVPDIQAMVSAAVAAAMAAQTVSTPAPATVATVSTTDPPKRKRGRPSKAELAARAAATPEEE